MTPRVLLVDNYDSFVYNLVQELGELGAEPVVKRNDATDVAGIRSEQPDGIVISPGPGRPEESGISLAVVEQLAGDIPILGVCLGHQCIGQAFGAEIVQAPVIMHGKTSMVSHDGRGVFSGLPDPFVATRYHSLVIAPDSVHDALRVTARMAAFMPGASPPLVRTAMCFINPRLWPCARWSPLDLVRRHKSFARLGLRT